MNEIQYHPPNLKADRLVVQPAKRSLHGYYLLALANHPAPIVKIKGNSWICDGLFLVLCLTVRSVVTHRCSVNY
ncbi:hypothetical protein D3C77_528380 [compost metagenome]